MQLTDRMAIILRPTESLLNWLQELPLPDITEMTMDELLTESTVLLIPEMETAEEVEQYIRKNAARILEGEFSGWIEDEALWPGELNFTVLEEYFELELHSVVMDSVTE